LISKLVLVGDVDYAADLPRGETSSQASTRSAFESLPGTRDEVQQIAAISLDRLPQTEAVFLGGRNAGRAALEAAAGGARWLHIATHGFLFDDPGTGRQSAALALTAANGAAVNPADDGILTPEEVLAFDLNVNDLVFLSACETGLGDPVRGEGIAGLQTAWHLAGAKTVITTLWQIDDRATAALIAEFYRNLWERKLSKRQSLRQAQLALLRGELSWNKAQRTAAEAPDPRSRGLVRLENLDDDDKSKDLPPFYWAAFTISGDGR
jgi:CHAT domain-containing protein